MMGAQSYVLNLEARHARFLSEGGRLIDIPYDYKYDMDGKSRTDWSGKQSQRWTSPQRNPQKTKFPYGFSKETRIEYVSPPGRNMKVTYDTTPGSAWYFEDELVMTYAGDKRSNNISMDGWTGGKILMTKQQAFDMGLTPEAVLNFYRQDEQFKIRADSVGRKPAFFFEYRKDGSIIGIYKPPIVPPPAPVQIPNPLTEPLQALHEQLIEAQLTPQIIQAAIANPQMVQPAPPPEPVPVSNVNPYQLTTTINPKWILLAILGVGILSALIFIMRGKK